MIAAFGRHLLVRDAQGVTYEARPFGRRVQAVCGDRVRCAHDPAHDEVHVNEILPRRSVLARATVRGEAEAVVANVTQLAVVIAPLPLPDPFIVDRYLCAAASLGIDALLVLNKSDLLDADALAATEDCSPPIAPRAIAASPPAPRAVQHLPIFAPHSMVTRASSSASRASASHH